MGPKHFQSPLFLLIFICIFETHNIIVKNCFDMLIELFITNLNLNFEAEISYLHPYLIHTLLLNFELNCKLITFILSSKEKDKNRKNCRKIFWNFFFAYLFASKIMNLRGIHKIDDWKKIMNLGGIHEIYAWKKSWIYENNELWNHEMQGSPVYGQHCYVL